MNFGTFRWVLVREVYIRLVWAGWSDKPEPPALRRWLKGVPTQTVTARVETMLARHPDWRVL